ncbi:MAG TPA: NAD(P)/FAD-dependent oxidoreductase [Polyangiales bacterium]
MSNTLWDVLIVGAGPGGSTISGLLAQRGFRVLVLEKDEFPRFHIGESLLPAACRIQGMLGVVPDLSTFNFKRGAEFIQESTGRSIAFDFNEALPGPPRHAYQVERAQFDTVLRDRALALGAVVRHGVHVTGVEFADDCVRVQSSHGPERARFFVDATGQDRLLATQQRTVEPFRHFGKAASFMHYEGLSTRTLSEFEPHNDIRVMIVDEGWAWVIPLTHGRVSIGLVSRNKGMSKTAVRDYVASSKLISRWVEGAHATEPRMIGNFSYRNTRSAGPRWACIGDAACFIDPVFSSGVSLAMIGALNLADQLTPALRDGREADPELTSPGKPDVERAYDTFAALVYRWYNTRFVDNFILGAPARGELRPGVTSVLAGDVVRTDNPFADMLLNSRIVPPTRSPVSDEPSDEVFEGC